MQIIGIILAAIGAVICFGAKKTYKILKKKEPNLNELLVVKLIGYIIAAVGAFMIITGGRS